MPGFLDKMKSGAERATFEADRLRRLNQAKTALRALEGDMETQVGALGQQALELYDAGRLTQPELLDSCAPIGSLRKMIEAQAAAVERIHQEKPAAEPSEEQVRTPEVPEVTYEEPQKPAVESAQGRLCANCQSPLLAGARFCQECGTPAPEAQAA